MCFSIPSGWEETILCELLLGNMMQLGSIRYLFIVWNACKQFNIVLLRYFPSRPDPLN